MSHARSCLVALAALALLPSPASAARGCAKPHVWKLSAAQVRAVTSFQVNTYLRRGPLHVSAVDEPLGNGPWLTASTAGPWRICKVLGRDAGGTRWSIPGTYGVDSDTSFAMRRITRSRDVGATKEISVLYGRRRAAGGGCGDPLVAYYSPFSAATVGDPGATLNLRYSGEMQAEAIVHWVYYDPVRICRVVGDSAAGEPWVNEGGCCGAHTMHSGARIGTHSNPLNYLWVEFTR